MSKISLAVLAATKGEIHVHVDVAPGAAYGIAFSASDLIANLSSFEKLFAVTPSSRRERSGHRWTMARLLKACKAAPSEKLAPAAQTMFEQAFANGCVWDVVNDPGDPDGARRRIFERLKLGVPAHIRAIEDAQGASAPVSSTGSPATPTTSNGSPPDWSCSRRPCRSSDPMGGPRPCRRPASEARRR